MRGITKEEMKKVYPDLISQDTEEIDRQWMLRHAVFEEEFSCNKCSSAVYISQDPKGYDATLGCLNPECDNKAIVR